MHSRIRELRRTFEFDLQRLLESVSASVDDVSPDLKVKHKATGFLYTVVSVSKKDVVLRTPEGKEFIVDAAQFEEGYEV
jgi:hypothetical protein